MQDMKFELVKSEKQNTSTALGITGFPLYLTRLLQKLATVPGLIQQQMQSASR